MSFEIKPQAHPDLDDLIGVQCGDEETECHRCHCLYMLRDGEQQTKYCR